VQNGLKKSSVPLKNRYLAESVKRSKDVALRVLQKKMSQYKLNDVLELTNEERVFKVTVNEEMLNETALLDGCYVIKTDVKKELLSTKEVHDRYKDLAKVEHAFRTFKQSYLEIRPVHVRTEASTRGHVFAVMLAYKIKRQLSELWKKCECTVPEGIGELGAIRSTIITLKEASCQKIPQSKGLAGELLTAAGITLPSIIEARNVDIVTRKKLTIKHK